MIENSVGPDELEVILEGINFVSEQDKPTLACLAASWSAQSEREQMTRERYDTIVHSKTVEASAILPTLELFGSDEDEFYERRRLLAYKLAEIAVFKWAFKQFKTIDAIAKTQP